MMLNKKLKRVIACVILSFCTISTTAFAGTWKQEFPGDNEYWHYIKDDGRNARNEWIYDNGSWYYIDNNFDMVHGGIVTSEYDKAIGGNYCFEESGKLATGGFVDIYLSDGKTKLSDRRYFADKDGHPVHGLFMVDGDLYNGTYDNYFIFNDTSEGGCLIVYDKKQIGSIDCKYRAGKVVDTNGKPFTADSELYSKIDYLPKYDSKGNLIGAIKHPNGYFIK